MHIFYHIIILDGILDFRWTYIYTIAVRGYYHRNVASTWSLIHFLKVKNVKNFVIIKLLNPDFIGSYRIFNNYLKLFDTPSGYYSAWPQSFHFFFSKKKRWKNGTIWEHLPTRYYFLTILKKVGHFRVMDCSS